MKNTVESARKFLESKGCTDTGTLRLCSTMEGGTLAEWMVEYGNMTKNTDEESCALHRIFTDCKIWDKNIQGCLHCINYKYF